MVIKTKAMALSTGVKVALGAAGVLALGTIITSNFNRLRDASNNFLFNVFFKRVHSLKNGVLTVVYGTEIKNLSGISVTVKNVFVLLQFSSDSGMNWTNIGASSEKLTADLNDNSTTSLEVPVQINMSDTLTSLLAKSNRYRVVVKYDVFGAPQQFVKAYDFTQTLKKIPGFGAVEGLKKAKSPKEKRGLVKGIVLNIKHIYQFPFLKAASPEKGKKPRKALPKAAPVKPSLAIPPRLTQALELTRITPVNPIPAVTPKVAAPVSHSNQNIRRNPTASAMRPNRPIVQKTGLVPTPVTKAAAKPAALTSLVKAAPNLPVRPRVKSLPLPMAKPMRASAARPSMPKPMLTARKPSPFNNRRPLTAKK